MSDYNSLFQKVVATYCNLNYVVIKYFLLLLVSCPTVERITEELDMDNYIDRCFIEQLFTSVSVKSPVYSPTLR